MQAIFRIRVILIVTQDIEIFWPIKGVVRVDLF